MSKTQQIKGKYINKEVQKMELNFELTAETEAELSNNKGTEEEENDNE